MGICEEKGSGIDKVIQSAEDYQLPAPDFRVGVRRTTAVMFAHQEFEDMSSENRIRACYQHCILRYLMSEKMTNQSLRERFKLPQTTAESVSRVIRDMVDADRIKLDDPKTHPNDTQDTSRPGFRYNYRASFSSKAEKPDIV